LKSTFWWIHNNICRRLWSAWLEPVGAKNTELLFSSLSSQHWENCINTVIILDNEHRFKEDPENGQMLKRMWSGDLTKEDRKRINTRVLGTNGLELPLEL
jgi:Fe-S cluster biosynthesis and repair protein YggX